jgi:tetratricopeptide (TPR) repeat protein
LAAQKKLAEAEAILEQATRSQPKQLPFWTARAEVAIRRGEWQDASRILDECEKQNGDTVDLRLSRARCCTARPAAESGEALARLAAEMEHFSAEEQARLLRGLAVAASQMGDLARAETFWTKLASHPRGQQDPRLHLHLFELAMANGREPEMRAALDAVQRIEGDQGVLARYGKALYLIWEAEKKAEKSALAEARQILDELASQRPSWPAVPLAKAEIDRQQKRPELAIANYRKAIELGDRGARVVRPLVHLLYQANRYAEANQEIQRLQKETLTKDLKQVAAMLSLRTNNPESAMELASGAVSAQSKDYRDYLWLGQVMAVSRRFAEAEQQLRRATELGETHPETWIALVQFLSGRDKAAAEQTIEQARKRIPPEQAPLAIAQCLEAVGDTEKALQQYRTAMSAHPEEMRTLRSFVAFQIKIGRAADAEPFLRQVVNRAVRASDDDVAWARRSLAVVLAGRSHFKSFREALTLVGLRLLEPNRIVEEKPLPTDGAVEEQRARARVLASHKIGGAMAIALLEELGRRQQQTADDQLLLAQLYEHTRSWTRAAEVLRGMISEYGAQPLYVAYYAQNLLRDGKYSEAEAAVRTLEELEKSRETAPGTLGTVELRVQMLKSQGQHEQAIALLKRHAQRNGARPEEIVVLIGYLSRINRTSEALDLCEQAWKTCPPEIAGGASVNAVKAGKPAEADLVRVEGWLRAAIDKKPTSTILLMHLADLQGQRGKYQEEESIYDKVLSLDATNIVAMNNRAWLLALRSGNGSAAQPLIESALEILGPRPELLDTRAMVHLAMNDAAKAIADLEKAVTLDTPTASRYFHLARAYHMANNPEAAIKAFRKAKELGLERSKLHPVELAACGKLFDDLDRR